MSPPLLATATPPPPSAVERAEHALATARDPARAPLERLAALGAISEALDAHFGGRASLPEPDGAVRLHGLVEAQYRLFRELAQGLAGAGLPREVASLAPAEAAAARAAFRRDVFPALTPLAIDRGRPFPRPVDRAVEVAVMLGRTGSTRSALAVVRVPRALPRLVAPGPGAPLVLLEDLVAAHASELFPGHELQDAVPFRLTRGSEGRAARLELAASASEALGAALAAGVRLPPPDVYFVPGPLQLQDLAELVATVAGAARRAG